MLTRLRRHAEAVAAIEVGLEREPGSLQSLPQHALLLHGTSRVGDAVVSARRGWRAEPNTRRTAYTYALCLV